eukprot:TRINITY_DN43965_c0_g1_i1.p1 TRINITY_DN43965_c0_g1~~TRINITY_DN43965_c0_g1_i1.p1  ORF type:complete len:367 (+),score=42.97 TRINITY_DN43965_c0_g1_i1:74-1174(+)
MTTPVDITVEAHNVCGNKEAYTIYTKHGDQTWLVTRPFREFLAVSRRLGRLQAKARAVLPPRDSPMALRRRLNLCGFRERRRQGLFDYLVRCMAVIADPDTRSDCSEDVIISEQCVLLVEFLGGNRNVLPVPTPVYAENYSENFESDLGPLIENGRPGEASLFGRPSSAMGLLLPSNLVEEVSKHVPEYLRYASWSLAYSRRRDGISLQTFYRRQMGPNVIVMSDDFGNVFGAFTTEPWRPADGNYGTKESFVFAVRDPGSTLASSGNEDDEGDVATTCHMGSKDDVEEGYDGLDVFRAQGDGSGVVQWSDQNAIGCGNALVVEDNLQRGSSVACCAYLTKSALGSTSTNFVVRDFECWHIDVHDF